MAALAARRFSWLLANRPNLVRLSAHRCCSDKPTDAETPEESTKQKKLSGFAQSFQRQFKSQEAAVPHTPAQDESFATLLRNSKFMDLGDPKGKIVSGYIYHIVGDDLYIDFGFKFPCVCIRPARNGAAYVRGAKVRLRINELELSTRFLGSERDMTLLEADCTLLGLIYSPAQAFQASRGPSVVPL
ncbi:small ribosomal subunit protein bS1m [Neocloeon triangulifer]|uniref:small ribosomal subunit protein bS1m n=1 Tax=Neocloeon triangulifer TaxID=2078957 RepID=UPI00286F3666|nr:small ribosomal subunit protein bS1m [Neocloeon triangulifer]